MTRNLQRHGNSYALIFDKTMMEALGINADSLLQTTITGNSLLITPANVGITASELEETIYKLQPRYKKMLENLAK